MEGFSAKIDRVDVVGQAQDNGSFIDKGLGILKSRISLIPQGQHAEYLVTVTRGGQYYTIRKRFSEFAQLHDFLKGRFGAALPCDLPSKTLIRHFDPGQLEDRKNALNAYLKEICSRRDLLECMETQRFFEPQSAATFGAPPAFASASASASAGAAPSAGPAPARDGDILPGGAPTSMSAPRGPPRVPPPAAGGARHDPEDDLVGWDR